MAQKPFVVKNGLSVNDTVVVGSNAKIHSNNAISDGTILESQLAFSPLTSTANNLANYVTNTDFQFAISDRMQVANVVSYVNTSIAALVNSAPTTLDTLDELAAALNDDENFAATVATSLGTKASNSFVTSTYVTNTTFQSTLANTNLAVADRLQVANGTLLFDDRMQVANTIALYNTIVANTLSTANGTSLINDRMQVANTNTLVEGAIADALAFAVALG